MTKPVSVLLDLPSLAAVADDASDRVDEAEVVRASRAGDHRAFRGFVATHERMVFAFLSRMVGHDPMVDDLAQEVFVRAYRALPSFDPGRGAKVSTWLLTIARNVAIDAHRASRPLVALDDVEVVDPRDPESAHQQRELAAALSRAAAALSHDQREALVLAEFHGLSMAEIAAVVSAPVNTVKQRLSRARERMRVLLGPTLGGDLDEG